MSVATTAIVEGNVARITKREVTAKTGANAGKQMVFTSMLVVGEFCIANVRINTDAFETPKQGTAIRAQIEIGTYRDDDEASLIAYL